MTMGEFGAELLPYLGFGLDPSGFGVLIEAKEEEEVLPPLFMEELMDMI